MPNELGECLKKIRGNRSLREMEKVTGISYTYLSNLEKGRDPRTGKPITPSIEVLRKLSLSLHIPAIELMEKADMIDLKDWYLEKLKNPYSKNEYDDLLTAKSQGYKSVEEMRDQQKESSKIFSTWYAIRDLKVFLELNVEDEIGGIIYPVYNGHRLTKNECRRILDVLAAMFPQYLKEKGKDD